MNKNNRLFGNILLLITAMIWGSAFVSQRMGMNYVEPFTFNSIRTLIGGIVLLPFIAVFNKKKTLTSSPEQGKAFSKELVIGGILCGIALFAASSLQQIGIKFTTAGKAGFITSLYIVLVPLMGLIFGRKVRASVWGAVVMALGGLYMLCIDKHFAIEKGDFFVLICAFFYAAHILIIGHFSPKVDGLKLSCFQFIVAGLIGLIFMFLLETPRISDLWACILPLLYSGVFSCGIAYTLQIIAQKHTEPAIASLLMSFEAVFAVISGWLILGEGFTQKELAGCALMFCAIILAQRPDHVNEKGDLI